MKINEAGYVVLDSYGVTLALPVEAVPLLMQGVSLKSEYTNGGIEYKLVQTPSVAVKLITAEQMHAIFAASKLEES